VGNEQYFLHVVGMAKGRFDNATIGVSKRGLVRVEKREGRNWVATAGWPRQAVHNCVSV
jgi:hypothetical protein